MAASWLDHLTQANVPAEGMAKLFGVILYTDQHLYVKEVLVDDNYRKALNELSGTRWNVFAACGQQGNRPKGFVRAVWKEPEANKEVLEKFGLESTECFPILIIFVEDDTGLLRQRAIPIKGDSKDAVFKNLSESLQTVDATLKKFLDENLRVETRAFDVLNEHLDVKEQWELMKKIGGLAMKAKDWIKAVLSAT